MPSVSQAQFRFFQMAKHNPAFAKKHGISKRVANEFTQGSPKGLPERKAKTVLKSFGKKVK